MVALRLWYEPGLGGHQDLFVRFVDETLVVDSYYFAIAADQERRDVRQVVADLLESWARAIESLRVGDRASLPYDLSDQYVGYFEVKRLKLDLYEVRRCATTSVAGYEIDPADTSALAGQLRDVQDGSLQSSPVLFSLDGLRSGLAWSRERARKFT